MIMAQLTEQQLSDAAADMHKAWLAGERDWNNIAAIGSHYTQVPWDEPTDAEVQTITSTDLGLRLTTYTDELKRSIVSNFVRRRNAALSPKPPDPRRDKIITVLAGDSSLNKTYGDMADRILKALDEVK